MTVYISGRTNYCDNAEQDYKQAQLLLESKGHVAFNVYDTKDFDYFESELFVDKSISSQFKTRLITLLQCEAIFLLPDWHKSKESSIEYQIARELKMKIADSESPDWEDYLK